MSRSALSDVRPAAAGPPGAAPCARAFDDLAREFFSVWLRYHPAVALAVGVADYADQLPPRSDDDQAALGSWLETLIVALEELDFDALDRSRRIDLELMFAMARVEHRELMEWDWRHRDPLRHLPLNGIHRLTLLQPEGLRDALAAVLRAIPDQLRLAQTQLGSMPELVPPVLAEAALAAADDGRRYLRELGRSRWLRKHCHACGELETLAEAAAVALGYFGEMLAREVLPRAAGLAACGPAQLQYLLHRRHFIDVEPSVCRELLDALAAEVAKARGPLPAHAEAVLSAPGGLRTLEAVRAESAALAERLESEAVISLPPAPLLVHGGPVRPRRGGPGIDYVPDLRRGEGILTVADVGREREEPVRDHGALRLACLHQGWGGVHLLTFAGGMAARSLPRQLAARATLAGGWALVLERRLFDNDRAAGADRARVLQRRARAIGLARIDLDLHCGRLDAPAALERMSTLAMDRFAALAALAGIVQRPGDALATVLGWQMTERVRPRAAAGSERAFNDRLLGLGPIPLPLALRHAFGEDLAAAAAAALSLPGAAGGVV